MSTHPDWFREQQEDEQRRAMEVAELLQEAREKLGREWVERLKVALWDIPAPSKRITDRRPF